MNKKCELPCKWIKENYLPTERVKADEYWKSQGELLFNLENGCHRMSIMEQLRKPWQGKKGVCTECGGKIKGYYGFVETDDTFLWVLTPFSGLCRKCAEKQAEKNTEMHARHNEVLYVGHKTYSRARGSVTYYDDGSIVEDTGQDLTLNPSYEACV